MNTECGKGEEKVGAHAAWISSGSACVDIEVGGASKDVASNEREYEPCSLD
jgi:hypothetical protein